MKQAWIVNHYALSPEQSGGTRHYNLASLMLSQDIESTIFASSVDYATRKDSRIPDGDQFLESNENGVKFIWLKTREYSGNGLNRLLNMLDYSFKVMNPAFSKNLAKPDIIIGSSPHLFAALSAFLLAKRYKVPFALEIRDIWPKTLVDLGNVSPLHPLIMAFGAIEKFLYKNSQLIITLLPASMNHIETVAGRKVPVIWLPNGVNFATLPNATPKAKGEHFDVIYAGAHGLANSLNTVIEAADLLRKSTDATNIRIILTGDGPEKEKLQKKASELALDNVIFRNPVPKHLVPSEISGADACIMPLLDSPVFEHGVSPNKLFDYLAAARPVIFSIRTPINAVAQANAGVSIPPEDPQALAEAILHLSRLPAEERQAMGERGRAYVMEHHDMKGLAAKLANALHALTGK